MPPIRLIDKAPPTAKQAVLERAKAMPNPRQELQCPRCGSRTYLTERNGATLSGGALRHGTMIERCVCAHCYKQGIKQTLMPAELKRI